MNLKALIRDFHQIKLGANVLNLALDRNKNDDILARVHSLSQCIENMSQHIVWLLMNEEYKNEH
jgi:hypothetical protein